MKDSEFATIIEETRGVVLSAIEKNLNPRFTDCIDDVAQETYLRAYKSLQKNKFRGDSALSTWLYAIARNESLRMNQKRLKEEKHFYQSRDKTSLLESVQDIRNGGNRIEEFLVGMDALRKLLDALPEKYRAVMNLYSIGFKEREIAEKMGLSRGTVKSRTARAREKLEKMVRQDKII